MSFKPIIISLAFVLLGGCQSTRDKIYYGTLEKFGVQKREVLVDRVEEAQESQQAAKEEFQNALQAFMSVVDVDGGDLEQIYQRLDGQLKRVEKRAARVNERIDAVVNVAEALFREWEDELDAYESERLRRQSEQTMHRTRELYEDLIVTMRRAESKMDPVLRAFRDQVLYLKHNLNAMAIASIRNEVSGIESEVTELIDEMERAIAEAEAFIAQMKS